MKTIRPDQSRQIPSRTCLLALGGVGALAMLISSIALGTRTNDSPAETPAPAANATQPAAGAKRFTLRHGEGFRFADGVVVPRQDDSADLVFKYLPPQVGGMALRYNPVSQQVERGLEPTLTSPIPLLIASHINSFDNKPDTARITSGDIAAYTHQAMIGSGTRYLLLMTPDGGQYLLTLDELQAVPGKYDEWRVGFRYPGCSKSTLRRRTSGRSTRGSRVPFN